MAPATPVTAAAATAAASPPAGATVAAVPARTPSVSAAADCSLASSHPSDPAAGAMLVVSPHGGRVANSGDPTRRGGRLQDPVWNGVLISDDVVSCKKCEKIIHTSGKTHVERVRYHFAKKCLKRAYTPAITTCFRPAISPVKVAAFQRKFALWFYSTGMAFNKAAHPTLAAALGDLTPTIVVPTRKQLASTMLKTCYEETRATVMHKLRDRNCTLVTDAWMDVNGKSVVNYVALDEELVVFLETVYTGSTSHDAAFLAAGIRRVIAKYPIIRFVAVVTDNTASNQLVWATLQKENQRMFFHGCISHALHLMVKDFVRQLPWLQKLEQDCRQLVRFLKKSQQLWHELRRFQQMDGKVAHVLPVDTRWRTIERCFASIKASEETLHAFVNSRDFLRSGSKEQKAKRRHAHDTVVARDFVQQLDKAIRFLSVLSAFQKAFEKNAKPPSDVYRMFLELPKIYRDMEMPIGELGKITWILEDRFNFIYGDAHGVAYLLDPRYLGRGMDEDTRQQVDDFITAWNTPENEDATAVELVKYLGLSREGSREAKLIADTKLTVLEYWRGLFQFPMLQEIALTVFAASCSSAAAERNFSAHKFVHSQTRNRLQDASVEKLIFLFFNAKNFDAEDVAFYDFMEDMADASNDEETNNRDEDFEYY